MPILKKFLSYYKPYVGMFYADMLCAVVVSVIDLSFPQFLKHLTNGLYQDGAEAIVSALKWILPALVLLYLLRSACQYYITSWGHIMGARMESDMRQELFDHYQKLSFSYYDKHNTGEMMSKLTADLFDISELAHHGPENLFISLLKIMGAIVLLMMIHGKLTAILLAVVVVMLIFCFVQNRKMRAVFTDNRQKIGKVNARVQDSLGGIRVVKSFANEPLEREKFRQSNQAFLDSKEDNYYVMGRYHATNHFFQGMLYTTVLVGGGYYVADGTLTVGALAVYALYIAIFISPIELLINFTEQFQRGYAGFRRFYEVVTTLPEVCDRDDAENLQEVEGDIIFDDVSFSYETNHEVLEHINLTIKAGKTVALIGASGGGKTTLCSLLPRFYDVTSGAIRIDGKDIRNIRLHDLRSAIGIVQQDVYIFGGTIRDNILYGNPEATEEEMRWAAHEANLDTFIDTLADGYDTFVGEHGVRLSGGQKQRLSIARLFLKNPKILILDEATSALDNESERYIQASLERLAVNRTTIVIAHRLSTIRNADEIVVIDNGRIEERGTHTTLLGQNGIYARYYRMQFDGLDEENNFIY